MINDARDALQAAIDDAAGALQELTEHENRVEVELSQVRADKNEVEERLSRLRASLAALG